MLIRTVTVLTLIAFFFSASVCDSREIQSDSQILKDAIKAAETYWDAQKVSDEVLFHSVTPQQRMNIVFEWSYVNRSDVLEEEAPIESIKSDFQSFLEHHKKIDYMSTWNDDVLSELKSADAYATNIEKAGFPMLGNLLKKAFWSTIIPSKFADMDRYKLMSLKYIADVKAQGKGANVIQKRTTLHLYRMQADDHDSGWKVFFMTGLFSMEDVLEGRVP